MSTVPAVPQQSKEERRYFVCRHVIEGEGVWYFGTNPKPGERAELLCSLCDDISPSAVEGQFFGQAEAVKRGWIPKARSMRYLLNLTNDCTGGQAVDSRHSLLVRRIHDRGLDETEEYYLYLLFCPPGSFFEDFDALKRLQPDERREYMAEFYKRVPSTGFHELTTEQEQIADRLIKRMHVQRRGASNE